MAEAYLEEEEFEGEIKRETLVRLMREAGRNWPLLIGFLVAITAVSIGDSLFTYLSKLLIDDGITAGNPAEIRRILTIYGGLVIVQSIMVFAFIAFAGIMGERVKYALRKKLFNHLQTLSFSYYDKTPLGWLMSRMTSDVTRVGELVSWGFLDITWGITNITAAMAFMFYLNWRLSLVILALIPVLITVAIWFQRLILAEYRLVRKTNSRITGAYSENITGVRVVKSLRREEKNLDEFQGLTTTMYESSFRAAWLSALFLPAVQMITAVGVASVVWISGYQFSIGSTNMTLGTLHAFISYVTFMLWPIQEMARVFASMQQAVASAERIYSTLDTTPEVTDKESSVDVPHIRGEIVFDHVDFYYEEEKPVLKDFSLTIKQGETIALVGPTGAGKSTIVNLMCRFYEPKAGQIRINGTDYTDLSLHSIHSRIGMVLQTPHLFSGTVRENLRYGRLNASDEEVVEAAKMAGAHDFIITLDEGYDTEVGEGGVLLSVGQKQLLSLARAILARPDIFIMDEATSSVDTLTEALIQKAMDVVMQDRTSIVIAHRLSTIKRADRIIVLKGGEIDEIGSHAELIRKKGHYYNLYTKQFRAEMEATYDNVNS